jgi:hypothetical protein
VDVIEANGGNTFLGFIKRLFGGSWSVRLVASDVEFGFASDVFRCKYYY